MVLWQPRWRFQSARWLVSTCLSHTERKRYLNSKTKIKPRKLRDSNHKSKLWSNLNIKRKKNLYNDLKVQKSKEWKGEMIDESSWVGNNSREKTCVVEIKREKKKKNCTVTDSNSDRHRFLFFYFFSKNASAREWLTHAAFFFFNIFFFKKLKWHDCNH